MKLIVSITTEDGTLLDRVVVLGTGAGDTQYVMAGVIIDQIEEVYETREVEDD
jgi:hypothetical protein